MKNKVIAVMVLMLVIVGCGTRKVATDISKSKSNETEKSVNTGGVVKETKEDSKTETTDQTAKTDEKQESRTRELFDENGKLKERITELINSKSADNSSKKSSAVLVRNINTDSVFTNTIYRVKTITIKEKSKDVAASKNGTYWLIGVVCVIGLVLWLKPWVK